jgi:3-hydroxyisobutyrate dehydrogenase-like beta-hydroxyacid dehydrogenase
VLDIRVPKILNGTLQDTFSIDNETKDLDLAIAFFGDADPLEFTRATHRIYREAQENGWGSRDIGRLFEADAPA